MYIEEPPQTENEALPTTIQSPSAPKSTQNSQTVTVKKSSNENTKQIKENLHLLKALPKITSKDYTGKELCTACSKEVKDTQQSISCDTCSRWTHRKCTHISIKKFKLLAKKNSFEWFCRNCRENDEIFENPEPESILQVTQKQDIPENFEKVKKLKNEMLIVHINCRSAVKKFEELQDLAEELNPDIICISESWFDNSIPLNSHIPEGYNIIRKDRTEEFQIKYKKNHGGGVAIIYKNYLNLTEKKSLNDKTEDILWAQVKTKNSFLLGVIYRPDYSKMLTDTEESSLERNIKEASLISNQILITGDFNVNMRDPQNSDTMILKDIYKTYSLKQQITKATRIDSNTGKAKIIDHIWTTPEIKLKSTGTFLGLSDHFGVYAKLPKNFTSFEYSSQVKFRSFKNYNKENFCLDFKANLENSNIYSLIQQKELNAATECLVNIIISTAAIHAPLKFRKRKKQTKNPWRTTALKEKISKKNKLLQDYYTTKNISLKKKASEQHNEITTLKRALKSKYITEEIEKAGTDPEKLWKLYKYLTGNNQPPEEIEPECMNQQKADTCNKYFSKIGETLIKHPPNPDLTSTDLSQNPNQEFFGFKKETQSNTEKMIDALKEKTATGHDEVNVKLVKDLKKEISKILTDIINLGYEINDFPDCMKFAIIKPIYKKDDRNDISNYRPIAILPALSKIIERSASNQLTPFFEINKKFTSSQHAYRKFHSPITCLAETINHIHQEIDSKKHAALITLDLSKAFDLINHKLLLQKLLNLGLHKSTLSWIKAYLSNRTQVTKFKNFTSKIETTSTGVPQGSILGPLFFICFTNDLPDYFKNICKINSYADDTQLLVTANSVPELKEKIEIAIKTAESWFTKNLMKINTKKTKVLVFNTDPSTKTLQFSIQNENTIINIEPAEHVEILGIFIDRDLSWKKQIKRIKRNAMGKIRNLHRINFMLPRQHRINLYNAIISPQFDYGDVLWGGANQKELNSLQRIQNFAIKSILGKKKKILK